MKIQEIKLKLNSSLNQLIDTYFSNPTVSEKMINATLKVLVKQNIHKVDDVLNMFADENGDINPQDILVEYANQIDFNDIIVQNNKKEVNYGTNEASFRSRIESLLKRRNSSWSNNR